MLFIGSCFVHLGLLLFALQDERTVVTDNFVEAYLGAAVHTGVIGGALFFPLIFGGILAFFTHTFRKTIHDAVYLEKANFQATGAKLIRHSTRDRHSLWTGHCWKYRYSRPIGVYRYWRYGQCGQSYRKCLQRFGRNLLNLGGCQRKTWR